VSAPQFLSTVVVYDYVYNPQGMPRAFAPVRIVLESNQATSTSPVVIIEPIAIELTTDQNGYWSALLVPNSNINPAGTLYVVRLETRTYRISVPSGAGPYQSVNLIV
jgi:hypothetical protein